MLMLKPRVCIDVGGYGRPTVKMSANRKNNMELVPMRERNLPFLRVIIRILPIYLPILVDKICHKILRYTTK